MFHGFDYPDETGKEELQTRFWKPVMADGIVTFSRPEECTIRKFVRKMKPKLPSSLVLGRRGWRHELDREAL